VAYTKSAKKRIRQSHHHAAANRVQRSAVRGAVRKVRSAPSADQARAALRQAERLLDRAARKRLIHPNAAARQKARLRKLVSQKTS
jgi:small subunit ribosomal protein S20